MRNHWNGCGLILHELCHLIHQQVLGLNCGRVKAMYVRAQQSGRYEQVLRRDWAGLKSDTDLSYSMIDHKEFFAEMSVTYWAKSYQELDKKSADMMEECSPPILEPTVLARFAGNPNVIGFGKDSPHPNYAYLWAGALAQVFLPRRRRPPHCNKFYPFTSGQLQHYDPILSADMENIWNDISMWEDPKESDADCTGCWNNPWQTDNVKRDLLATFEENSTMVLPNIISDIVEL
jgi:hypothetical protein